MGSIFECTFKEEGKHIQYQSCILFYFPSHNDLDNFKKINVLLAQSGCKEVAYDPGVTKHKYIFKGFK